MTAKLLIYGIRAYQLLLSPMFAGSCRFQPSCSAYAIEALRRHGAMRGSLLAVQRLARCRPFGKHGIDPVPDSPCFRDRLEVRATGLEQQSATHATPGLR